ncbi:aldose 1-epimerase [Leptospira fluminis]|uniref:Aldose 1-epimerase n=1 Tax=Leptospira fluminis TaxID=2484979 RepID=A0A4R9GKL9_9LEPT|nr:aldose 1-epimerase [Leptospira fluminis]TGK14721.1 aldose 1-epimerase [Leptospira fluminis]
MLKFRTENSSFTTDGTHWIAWDWIHSKTSKKIEILAPWKEEQAPFGSGCFLMFPWVNRHASSELVFGGKKLELPEIVKDSNGFPVHGFMHSLSRKALKVFPGERGAEFRVLIPDHWEDSPAAAVAVREEIILEEIGSGVLLTIRIKFNNLKANPLRFAFGYHPYFKLEGSPADWRIHLHLDKNLELDDKLLPYIPSVSNQIDSVTDGQIRPMDHLFYGKDPRVILENCKEKYSITILSPPGQEKEIPLEYYQIYTSPDLSSIAVEPCSAPGNALISGQGLTELKSYSELSGEFRILVKPT